MNLLPMLTPSVEWALSGIFGLLVVASITARLLAIIRPSNDYTELRLRVRSWWIMVIVFAIAVSVNRTVSVVFMAFVSFLAFKEYLSLIPTRRADRRVLLWSYFAIPLQYYWIAIEWYGMFIIFVPVYMFLLLPMRMVLIGETHGYLHAAGTLHWGLMTAVFSLGHAAYLLVLPADVNPDGGVAGLFLYLVFLTQLNDVAQYVWGKTLGRKKVLPSVSPGKTQSGLLGGVLTTVVLAWLLAPWLTPLSAVESLAAGLIIGVGGFIADVTISAVKRDLHVKDSGQLLPGHGGVLDRVDSLTYTAPLFFHFVYYLHY